MNCDCSGCNCNAADDDGGSGDNGAVNDDDDGYAGSGGFCVFENAGYCAGVDDHIGDYNSWQACWDACYEKYGDSLVAIDSSSTTGMLSIPVILYRVELRSKS